MPIAFAAGTMGGELSRWAQWLEKHRARHDGWMEKYRVWRDGWLENLSRPRPQHVYVLWPLAVAPRL